MNEKDLFKGLSNIDDDLIAEAARPRKKKGIRIPSAVACALCLFIGAGAAFGGSVIYRQNNELQELREEMSAAGAKNNGSSDTGTVGTAGENTSERYTTAASYKKLFSALKERTESLTSVSKGWGIVFDSNVDYAAEAEEAPAMEAATETAAAAGSSYSATNVMTEGVDESDTVKTDGSFIYMVMSGSVKITDIREGKAGDSVTVTPPFEAPSDWIRELFVDGSRMIIIVEHSERKTGSSNTFYGSNYRNQTFAYVYDITDPMKAELLGQMEQDGSYNTSRKVGDMVYLFTDQWIDVADVNEKHADDKDQLSNWVPSVNGEPIAYDCIYLPETGINSLVISSFRVDEPGTCVDAKTIINDYSEIYVGSGHIYLYSEDWSGSRELTAITSFSYKDGRIGIQADTTVSGGINDSFAIREQAGFLYVLTTDYNNSGDVNTLFVLDDQMKQVGRIDEIARGEEIYAARYVGNYAYFITYKNMDPLFVADLSDPTAPKLLGNVEISGFSDYLHVWDETHVLGIGYETTEASQKIGMKAVMFDVSDPMDPVIENTLVLDGGLGEEIPLDSRWYYSDSVSGMYKGILADPGKDLIGFAYTGDGWNDTESKDVRVYEVLTYDTEKGFTSLLSADLETDQSAVRGLYSGDWFYLAGGGVIRSFDMADNFAEK